MGVGRCLRRGGRSVRIHLLEPANSPTLRTGYVVGRHRIRCISDEFVPAIVENNGSCAICLADDDRMFVLFQDPRLPNDDFDTVTTPGTRSRLVLDLRSALGDRCREDAIAAVIDRVLESDGPGASRMMNEVELGLQNTVEQP